MKTELRILVSSAFTNPLVSAPTEYVNREFQMKNAEAAERYYNRENELAKSSGHSFVSIQIINKVL